MAWLNCHLAPPQELSSRSAKAPQLDVAMAISEKEVIICGFDSHSRGFQAHELNYKGGNEDTTLNFQFSRLETYFKTMIKSLFTPKIWSIIVITTLIMIVVPSCLSSIHEMGALTPEQKAFGELKYQAQECTELFVSEKLEYPDTANYDHLTFNDAENGGRVTGEVFFNNAFGVENSIEYFCDVALNPCRATCSYQ